MKIIKDGFEEYVEWWHEKQMACPVCDLTWVLEREDIFSNYYLARNDRYFQMACPRCQIHLGITIYSEEPEILHQRA